MQHRFFKFFKMKDLFGLLSGRKLFWFCCIFCRLKGSDTLLLYTYLLLFIALCFVICVCFVIRVPEACVAFAGVEICNSGEFIYPFCSSKWVLHFYNVVNNVCRLVFSTLQVLLPLHKMDEKGRSAECSDDLISDMLFISDVGAFGQSPLRIQLVLRRGSSFC